MLFKFGYLHVQFQFYVQDGERALKLYALDKSISCNTKTKMSKKKQTLRIIVS